MADDRYGELNFLASLGLIFLGAMLGAGAALLLAPKSGRETRELLFEKGSELAKRAQEGAEEAKGVAQDLFGKGKEVFEEQSSRLRVAFEAGREAMRQEMAKSRGADESMEGV